MTRKFLLILLPSLFCCLPRIPAASAEQFVVDLTARCEFSVSSNSADIHHIVDDDPETLWMSGGEEEPYLEIKMPATQNTISILWGGTVRTLTLETLSGEDWQVIAEMSNPDPMPKTLTAPASATWVRLRGSGSMQIAELRVTEGQGDSFFEGHAFRGQEVTTATHIVVTPPPLVPGMSGKTVKTLQKRLRELGFAASDNDSTFSQQTLLALTKFQRANNLPETGILDYATEQVLFGSSAISATPRPYDSLKILPRKASALVQFCHDQVGKGYIYGTSGVVSSKEFRIQAAQQYPKYADSMLTFASKWDGMEVFDCVGLVKAFLSRSDGPFPEEWNTNVTGAGKRWFVEMGTIDTMPKEPGILLLQWDPNTQAQFEHIGVYVGNGNCIHARGHMYGVVEEPMPHHWTHWGRAVWLEYDLPAEDSAPWPAYLAAGDVAQVDTSFNGDLSILMEEPSVKGAKAYTFRIPNKAYVSVVGMSTDPKYYLWRQVSYTNEQGETITGFVYGKDLSYVPVRSLAMEAMGAQH